MDQERWLESVTLATSIDVNVDIIEDEVTPLISGEFRGCSSYGQSVLNTVNLMVGTALISLPYTLKTGGWVVGLTLILSGALSTLYTAFLIESCLNKDSLRSLGDMGERAGGKRVRWVISAFYVFELAACGVSYVLVCGDTLHAIYPNWSANQHKILVASLMIVSSWTDSLATLSIASSLGILASILMVVITLYDGLSLSSGPGSLWMPEPTYLWPTENYMTLLLNAGLVMYSYSGHSVIPTIYKDMKHPGSFKSMISIAVSIWFLLLPIAVYLMFGSAVRDEFTLNLYSHPLYDKALNAILLWLVIIVPISKYALLMNPVAQVFENAIQKDKSWKLKVSIRTLLGVFILYIAIVFPNFTTVLSFVGALASFFITLVFPCACYIAIFGHTSWLATVLNWSLILIGCTAGIVISVICFIHDIAKWV